MSMYDSTDFANARFAVRPDGKFAARLVTGTHPELYPWRCSDIPGRSDRAMAEDGFILVRECPDPEQHADIDPAPILDEVARLDGELHDMRTRAVKAERERDEARDAASAANHAMQEARERFRTAAPRPLTPDAITDEMVKRARDAFTKHSSVHVTIGPDLVRKTIAAALTEPPARPEGAAELGELIGEYLDSTPGVDDKGMADFLAERGVRVIGGAEQ